MESSKCYTLNSSLNRYSFPFLIFTSLFKKRHQMNNVITTKKLILSKYVILVHYNLKPKNYKLWPKIKI